MRIADGVEMLEISATVMGKTNVIHPVLLWDKETALLIDTGYPGQLPLIREAMQNADVPFEKIAHVIITHQDIDHIGNLPNILQENPHKIEVLANEIEKPYIEGELMLLRITPEAIKRAEANLPEDLPAEQRKAFIFRLQNPPHAPVDTTVLDNQVLPYCGGITIINTPGHTPGHISLYHKPSRTLIAGDAMIVEDGMLQGPVPSYALDYETALNSLRKYKSFDIDQVICYHGGLFADNCNERIAALCTS